MNAQLKCNLATQGLALWSNVHAFYKKFKKNDSWKYYTLAIVLLIMLVLIMLRGEAGKKNSLGFDPYELLGVERTATKRDIQRVFRNLSRTKHPDVDKSPDAQENYLKLQTARDVLVDDKKRENFDKFGTPEDQSSLFDIETYPDWIRHPGKAFVAFYLLLATAALVLPLGIVFASPLLREPPAWIYNYMYDQIEEAEALLAKNDDESAMKMLDGVASQWKSLTKTFKKYGKTKYAAIFAFRIQARKALAQVYANNISEALNILNEVRKQFKSELTSSAVYAQTKHAVSDLKNAFSQVSLNKAQKKEVDELLQAFTK